MCTGIFLFGPRPVLALNFDYNRTFRLTLEQDAVFCMRMRFGTVYGLPLGVNRNGSSANIQLAPYQKNAVYDPDLSNSIHLHDIVKNVLDDRLSVSGIPGLLQSRKLIYTPDNIGAHCLCADRTGSVCIVEPGAGCLTNPDFPDGFAVLTNFTLAEHIPVSHIQPVRCSRYRTARRMLLEDRNGTERLLEILEAVKQNGGPMPTIFSMVAELDTGMIHFTLNGDFSKRYLFSFSDREIITDKGLRIPLTPHGISAADLFSESLSH